MRLMRFWQKTSPLGRKNDCLLEKGSLTLDDNKLLKFALDTGEIMLSSGAETHRVEDTMRRILSTSDIEGVEALALSTFLIVSMPSNLHGSLTLTRGVRRRSINFEKICSANDLSRSFVSRELTLAEAIEKMELINHTPEFPPYLSKLCFGIAGGCFALLYGGTWLDGFMAFIFCFIIGALIVFLGNKKTPYFFNYLFGGVLAGIFTLLFHSVVPVANINLIIIGSITPLMPGMTMTNSIRDIMEGNFISGTTRLVETVLIAFALAGGVGFGMSFVSGILG